MKSMVTMKRIETDNRQQPIGEPLLHYWNKGGFALCIEGCADIQLNGQSFRLTRGSLFAVTPLVQVYAFRPSADYREVSFVGELKEFYSIFQLISDTSIPLFVSEHPCWILTEREITLIMHKDEQLRHEQLKLETTRSADERRLLSYHICLLRQDAMLEVIGNRIRRCPDRLHTVNRQAMVAYRFVLLLHEHYRCERSVSWYASEAKLSAGHFTTIIRNTTGRTPSQWITTVTTTYAKLLLEQGGQSIKEIAMELNFPEQYTFRKYFKQHTGYSPKAYRERFSK